jgi:hypothetical protein
LLIHHDTIHYAIISYILAFAFAMTNQVAPTFAGQGFSVCESLISGRSHDDLNTD